MLCIWWDMKGVLYYELLKPGQTVTAELYRQQLVKVNKKIEEKLLHDNVRPHVDKSVKDTLMAFG